MSIFNPSRGTGSFGKLGSVENVGASNFAFASSSAVPSASPTGSGFNYVTTQSASSPQQTQQASGGSVQTGRTGTSVSSGSSRATQSTATASEPVAKRGIAVETISWGGPLSTVRILKSTKNIYENKYRYFPINTDAQLNQIESAVLWRNFKTLVSAVVMPRPDSRFYSSNVSALPNKSVFDILKLDLSKKANRSQIDMVFPRVERSSIMFTLLSGLEAKLYQVSDAAFQMALSSLRSNNWKGSFALEKIQFLINVDARLKAIQAQEFNILSTMFELFFDSHFLGYKSSNYGNAVTQRFSSLGFSFRPLSDSNAALGRNMLEKLWGKCCINPQVNNDVRMPTYSITSSTILGDSASSKIILRNNPALNNFLTTASSAFRSATASSSASTSSQASGDYMNIGNRFPMGDFLAMIASQAYLRTSIANSNALPQMDFNAIYRATSSQKSGYIKTLALFTNSVTMMEKYATHVGKGKLSFLVAMSEFKGSGATAILDFLKTGINPQNTSFGLATQNKNLRVKSSNRFVQIQSLLSTMLLIDVMSCGVRSAYGSGQNIGGYKFAVHTRNFLTWIPKRANYVAKGGVTASQSSSIASKGSSSTMKSASLVATKGSKSSSSRGSMPMGTSGRKSFKGFKSITAALANKQGKKPSPSKGKGSLSQLTGGALLAGSSEVKPSAPTGFGTTGTTASKSTYQAQPMTSADIIRVLSEPNIQSTLNHIELPLSVGDVSAAAIDFGTVEANQADDVVVALISLWVMYPEDTPSTDVMVQNSSMLTDRLSSDPEAIIFAQGLEDMLMLDDPEFSQALSTLPRRSDKMGGAVVDEGMMDFVDTGLPQDEMVDIELPQDEMVVVDIPQEQSTTQTASDEDTATGDTKSASDGDTKVAGDDDKAKKETSYTPWIIGGVVTTAVIGGIVYMNSKKKKAI